jgi:hypothetical protein
MGSVNSAETEKRTSRNTREKTEIVVSPPAGRLGSLPVGRPSLLPKNYNRQNAPLSYLQKFRCHKSRSIV